MLRTSWDGLRPCLALVAAIALWLSLATGAWAQSGPDFPVLSGRVVDQAELLSPLVEAQLDAKLAALERDSSDQLVVVTVPDLQGYEIEDFGYQLGRHWGIGQQGGDNGALLIVARDDRRVRIETGYGLEAILTDALSALIIQEQILPRFRVGDFEGGVVAGVDALDAQLRLDPAEAQARAAAATREAPRRDRSGVTLPAVFVLMIFLLFFFGAIGGAGSRGRRRRRGSAGDAAVLIWAANEMMRSSGRNNDGRGGGWGGGGFGGGGGGGGGFSGGGGSFGGGGASGGW